MLRPGSKQILGPLASDGTGNETIIGFVNQTLGARFVLLRVFSTTTDTFTIRAAASFDGTIACTGGGHTCTPTGSVAGSSTGLHTVFVTNTSLSPSQPLDCIVVPYLRITFDLTSVGPTPTITIHAWPIHEISHPNLLGRLVKDLP